MARNHRGPRPRHAVGATLVLGALLQLDPIGRILRREVRFGEQKRPDASAHRVVHVWRSALCRARDARSTCELHTANCDPIPEQWLSGGCAIGERMRADWLI